MLRSLRPAALGLLVLALVAPAQVPAQESRAKVPNFKVDNLDGDRVTLEDQLGKGPVLIDFWATWCKPCIKELPYVQRIADKYAEHGLKVFAVTIDTPRSQNQVGKFIKSRGYTLEVLMDGSQDVFRKCQGRGTVPYVVVLDAEGFIRYNHTGYRPGDEVELEHEVVKLLQEQGIEIEMPGAEEEDKAEAAPAKETTG